MNSAKMWDKVLLQKSTPLNSIRRKRGFVNKYLEKEGKNGRIKGKVHRQTFADKI